MKVEFDIEPHLFEAMVETSLGRNEDPMNPKFYFGREGVTVNAISTGRTMAFRGNTGNCGSQSMKSKRKGASCFLQ